MRFRAIAVFLILFAFVFALSGDAGAVGRKTYGKSKQDKSSDKPSKPNGKEKPFKELIEDKVKIEGLFTFYQDTTDNSVLMSITPEQIGPYFLYSSGRTAGDGTFYDTGNIGRTFPFYIKKIGKKLLFLEKNLRVRADTTNMADVAVAKGISDHLYASIDIKSLPEDSTKAVLIDPSSLFIRDAENTGYYLGKKASRGISFDKGNSYFETIKSFPENIEIDVKLHFRSSQPNYGSTLQSGKSFYHTYHYSFSSLPETDYVSRISDDRVGYFETMYQDYTSMDMESPYVRFIERWNLKKKNPDARISEPVEPIVFWIENTVPVEYRDAFAEGIEFWNQSFEKLGYRSVMVAKYMPDTADWDPLDVRYNTIRWMVAPGATYAIGPSRANPFTGQIYDADITVSSDFIRFMFLDMENYINPVKFDGSIEKVDKFEPPHDHNNRRCNLAEGHAKDAAFRLAYLLSSEGTFADKDSLTKEYVHAYIVELIAHEVGHTLGFRHNFKASTLYSLEQLSDKAFTKEHGIVGTVMEYAPGNVSPKGEPQGEFYASTPGAYDDWRVEYGYKDFGAEKPEDELEELKKIASRSGDPELVYATDGDLSYYTVDPLTNIFDLGSDPIAFCERELKLSNELWNNSIFEFEKDGNSYEKLTRVFGYGWRAYRSAARIASKYIGGIYHKKSYVGDGENVIPFTPVTKAEQKRALDFLAENIFAPDAFELPEGLLNKLQSTRKGTFTNYVGKGPIAYPWHQRVLNIQNGAIYKLYSPETLGRLLNNEERYTNDADRYYMYDMFNDVRKMIWTEIVKPTNVNTYRRQLQLSHLKRIIAIYLSSSVIYHTDARTLAGNDLGILENAAKNAVKSSAINNMTKAHFNEVIRQIESAKDAQKDFSILGM